MRSPCITTREKPSLAKIRENQCSKEDPPQLKINKSITFIKDLILNSSHMHSALKIHTFFGTFHFVLGYQFSSVAQLCPTLCDPMDCSTPGFLVHHQLPEFVLKLMSIQSVMLSNHLLLCHPLLLLPSIFPSIRVFSTESALRIR